MNVATSSPSPFFSECALSAYTPARFITNQGFTDYRAHFSPRYYNMSKRFDAAACRLSAPRSVHEFTTLCRPF